MSNLGTQTASVFSGDLLGSFCLSFQSVVYFYLFGAQEADSGLKWAPDQI